MRRRDTYWSLFHSPEKRQLNDLKTDHVEAIFDALPNVDHKDWLIWREGFRTWMPLADFPQLVQSLRQLEPAPAERPKPPSKSSKDAAEPKIRMIDEKVDTVQFDIAEGAELAAREDRYPKEWDLSILVGNQRYAAKTVDVSLHGMQLSEPISMSLPRYFTVEIRGAGHTFSVVCSAIRAIDMQPTSRLKIEVNDQMHAYTAAVLAK